MLNKPDERYFYYLNLGLYVTFLISVVFVFRAITSISIGLILLVSLIKIIKERDNFFIGKVVNPFLLSCSLLYLLKIISLLYTANIKEGVSHLLRGSGLIIIPLAVSCSSLFLSNTFYKQVMKYFIGIVSIATFYCLLLSFSRFIITSDESFLFYHKLVKPLSQHAIIFSILLFIALAHLLALVRTNQIRRPILYALIAYLSFFLILLSSKLVLIFYVIYVLHSLIKELRLKQKLYAPFLLLVSCIVIILILVTQNPIGRRFQEIASGNLSIVKQEKFTQGDYFNGLQFRLLQFRFVKEILQENDSWILGLGIGDAQSYLDNKYVSAGMYIGKNETGDRGFLGYNTHNQFLQSLLELGLIGLIAFGLICWSVVKMIRQRKNIYLSYVFILLILFSLIDTPLDTQYGLVLFTFFPLFLFKLMKNSEIQPNTEQ